MSVKKRVLGRGLDALLGSQAEPQAPPVAVGAAIHQLSVAQLKPNPFQPRHRFRPEALEELAASIQEKGILQPLVVRRVPNDGVNGLNSAINAKGMIYEIVAGERRWRAAQQVGLHEVPVIVREFNDQDMLELALIENLQREELNAIEEARAYRQLIEEFEVTQEVVAERVGKSRVAVTNALRLLRLPAQILSWIEEDRITAGHAKALLSLENEPLQLALAREIMAQGLSVREAERRVRKLSKKPDTRIKAQEPKIEIETRDLEEKLRLHLGLQVKIFPTSNNSGRVEVYYSSLDEFQRLFDHLGLSLEQDL